MAQMTQAHHDALTAASNDLTGIVADIDLINVPVVATEDDFYNNRQSLVNRINAVKNALSTID